MLRSILIGLDGSAYSGSAVELGIRWGRRSDALLVGLGIIDEPSIRQPEALPLGASAYKEQRDDAVLARTRRHVEQFLEQFALRCSEAGVSSQILEDVGSPYEQILLEAQRYDLIMLGQQTYFQFATQDSPDDTLQKLLKSTPRPVVTVPEKLESGSTIVVAYDGSLQAARALQAFERTGLWSASPVHIICVASDYEEAARCAGRAADFLRFHDIALHLHPLASSGAPADVIREQARQLNADLLVMGAYGQPTLREFLLGSVTRQLLKDAPAPFFLYH